MSEKLTNDEVEQEVADDDNVRQLYHTELVDETNLLGNRANNNSHEDLRMRTASWNTEEVRQDQLVTCYFGLLSIGGGVA